MTSRWEGLPIMVMVRDTTSGEQTRSATFPYYIPYQTLLVPDGPPAAVFGFDLLQNSLRSRAVYAAIAARDVTFTQPSLTITNRHTVLAYAPTLCVNTDASSLSVRVGNVDAMLAEGRATCVGGREGTFAGVSGITTAAFFTDNLIPRIVQQFPGLVVLTDITEVPNPGVDDLLAVEDVEHTPLLLPRGVVQNRGVFSAAAAVLY
ncbi:hypothetical protein EON67_09745, partial [archaeon]